MEVGYNTFDIFSALSKSDRDSLRSQAGDVLYRFPGGARAAAHYSFAFSGNSNLSNPTAYLDDFKSFSNRGVVVMNVNAEMQFGPSGWRERNLSLIECNPEHIELGNEPYHDKTIVPFKFLGWPILYRAAAMDYVRICKEYIKALHGYKVSVCLAPEETNGLKEWNRVVRGEFGDSVAYSHHLYARPKDVTQKALRELVMNRIGVVDREMHFTEVSWQYQAGIQDDPQKVAHFNRNIEVVLRELGAKSLIWWRLGSNDSNKYNRFKV